MLRCCHVLRNATAVLPLMFGSRAVAAIPHPEKRHRGGEDAFISHSSVVGVADGVGGYADSGVNPAIFTRQVMQHTYEYIIEANKKGGYPLAVDALNVGLKETLAKRTVGGCPVTLMTITGEGEHGSILNLGDCGTIVFRGDDLLYRTTVQQHYFNCPFQLPDDKPIRGNAATILLQPGDVIFQASDGVWDNVFDEEILGSLMAVVSGKKTTQDVADGIAQRAASLGADKRYLSPFAMHAKEQGYAYVGGKQDDVTVLVSVVAPRKTTDGSVSRAKLGPTLINEIFP